MLFAAAVTPSGRALVACQLATRCWFVHPRTLLDRFGRDAQNIAWSSSNVWCEPFLPFDFAAVGEQGEMTVANKILLEPTAHEILSEPLKSV
jgi:hypothetical protein